MKLIAFGLIILILAAFLFPLCSIWALNTLFGFSIQYTFWNWLAIVILIMTLQGAVNIKRK